MGVVKIVENNFVGALTQSYDLRAIGAVAVEYESTRDEGTQFQIIGRPVVAGNTQQILNMTSLGGAGGSDGVECGLPLNYNNVDFTWTGGGTRHNRIAFLDTPMAPYGRVPLHTTQQVIGAAVTQNLLTARPIGMVRDIQIVFSGNRASHVNISGNYHGFDHIANSFVTLGGAAGGFVVSSRIPAGGIMNLDVVNDDGALALTYQIELFGFYV
jgi:hypothetical protein